MCKLWTLVISYKQHCPQTAKGFTSQNRAASSLLSQFSSDQSVMSDILQPHGPQHARPPCPSPTPGASIESVMASNHLIFCHPFPASGSFPRSKFFASGGQSIGASASIFSLVSTDNSSLQAHSSPYRAARTPGRGGLANTWRVWTKQWGHLTGLCKEGISKKEALSRGCCCIFIPKNFPDSQLFFSHKPDINSVWHLITIFWANEWKKKLINI